VDSVKTILCLLGIGAFWIACNKDRPVAPGSIRMPDYYPLKEGLVWKWQVVDSLFTESDTVVKKWIQTDLFRTVFFGQGGIEIFPIDIFWSDSIQDSTRSFQNRISTYKTSQYHFEQVDNERIVALPYPLQIGKFWNAFAFSSTVEEYRVIKAFNQTWQNFNNCLEVGLYQPGNSLIDQYDFKELYAPEIGKVYLRMYSRKYTYINQSPVLIQGFTREKSRIL
jgi:hypothetical protein